MTDWKSLPTLGNSKLLFEDTTGMPAPGRIVPCLLCAKPFLMRAYVGAPDQICGECYTTYQDAARIICWQCKVTICRAMPKVLENGFYIKPRMILHSDACNVCRPGLKESIIIEIDQWERILRPNKIIITGNTNAKQ